MLGCVPRQLETSASASSPDSNLRSQGFAWSHYRHMSFFCISLYCASQMCSFVEIESKTLHQKKRLQLTYCRGGSHTCNILEVHQTRLQIHRRHSTLLAPRCSSVGSALTLQLRKPLGHARVPTAGIGPSPDPGAQQLRRGKFISIQLFIGVLF